MCGIAGIPDAAGTVTDLRGIAGRMAALLQHRGPDGHGTWVGAGMRDLPALTKRARITTGPKKPRKHVSL